MVDDHWLGHYPRASSSSNVMEANLIGHIKAVANGERAFHTPTHYPANRRRRFFFLFKGATAAGGDGS